MSPGSWWCQNHVEAFKKQAGPMTDYRQFYRTGRFSEAVRYCENELRLDPENAQAAILLARALAAIDDIDGSLRVIDNFISTGKMNEKVLSVGRYLSFQFGDFQRSIGYSEALLRLHSDDEKSHHHKIHALLALGMEASARQFAEESVSQIEPALQKARKAFERMKMLVGLCPYFMRPGAFVPSGRSICQVARR